MTGVEQDDLGVENKKAGHLIFDISTDLSRTDKQNYHEDMMLRSKIILAEPYQVEGFELIIRNKSIIMACDIDEAKLKQMLEYVQRHKEAKYNMNKQEFDYPINNVKSNVSAV